MIGLRPDRGRASGGMAILVAFELLGLMAGVAFATAGNVLRELALGGQVARGVRAAQAAEAGLGWFLARSGWAPPASAPPEVQDEPGARDLPEAPDAPEAGNGPVAPDVAALLAALEGPGQGAPPGLLAEPGDAEPLGFTVQARRLGGLPWPSARGADLDPEPKATGAAGVAKGVAAAKATEEAALWRVTATGICGRGREAFRQVRELLVAVPPAEAPDAPDDPDPADTADPRPGAPPGRPGLWVLAWRIGD